MRKLALVMLAVSFAFGCGSEPVTPVDYGQGLVQFNLPGEWQNGGQAGKAVYWTKADDPNVRVSVSAEVENWGGGAITQRQIRSALGSKYNRMYGNTQSVVTYEGTAMITFINSNDGARHWVVGTPYSIGYVQLADIGLHLPDSYAAADAQALVDKIQPMVGDAKFRE